MQLGGPDLLFYSTIRSNPLDNNYINLRVIGTTTPMVTLACVPVKPFLLVLAALNSLFAC